MTDVLIVLAAFILMEPITALSHRAVMHGAGWRLHRSHHVAAARSTDAPPPWRERIEANDAFPLLFAAIVCIGFAAGFNIAGVGLLLPVCVGVTAYGVAYALVHDGYIHGRLTRRRRPTATHPRSRAVLERLAEAHREHHRTGGAPYGMLLPMRSRKARERVSA